MSPAAVASWFERTTELSRGRITFVHKSPWHHHALVDGVLMAQVWTPGKGNPKVMYRGAPHAHPMPGADRPLRLCDGLLGRYDDPQRYRRSRKPPKAVGNTTPKVVDNTPDLCCGRVGSDGYYPVPDPADLPHRITQDERNPLGVIGWAAEPPACNSGEGNQRHGEAGTGT